jgi:ribonuclease J
MKLMFLLTKPRYFFPIHGEYRMLVIHSKLYEEVGGKKNHSFILSNGDTLLLRDHECRVGPRVQADDIYVDGNDLTGLSTAVLHDRQILSEDGMVSVLVSMDSHEGKLLNKPIIMSRGFVYMKDSQELIREAEMLIKNKLKEQLKGKTTFGEIKNTIRHTLETYFYQKTRRHPMIIPVIMNKKV